MIGSTAQVDERPDLILRLFECLFYALTSGHSYGTEYYSYSKCNFVSDIILLLESVLYVIQKSLSIERQPQYRAKRRTDMFLTTHHSFHYYIVKILF